MTHWTRSDGQGTMDDSHTEIVLANGEPADEV